MGADRTLFLHVGIPKTATTSLQIWCRDNRAALLACDLDYPELLGNEGLKHEFLVPALRAPNGAGLERLEAVLAESTAQNVLISNEGLSNHLYDFRPDRLKRFREITEGWRVEIIVSFRTLESWVQSYYRQAVINPPNGSSDIWGTALTLEEFRYAPRVVDFLWRGRLCQDLKRRFGAQGLQQIQFSKERLLEDFLGALRCQPPALPPLPRINESLPDWSIEFLRQMNKATPDPVERLRWQKALQAHIRSSHSILARLDNRPEIAAPATGALGFLDLRAFKTKADAEQCRQFIAGQPDRMALEAGHG